MPGDTLADWLTGVMEAYGEARNTPRSRMSLPRSNRAWAQERGLPTTMQEHMRRVPPMRQRPLMPAPPAWLAPQTAGDVQRPRALSAHMRGSPSAFNAPAGFLAERPDQRALPDFMTRDQEVWRQAAPEQIGQRVTPLELGGAAPDRGFEPPSAPNAPGAPDLTQDWRSAYQRSYRAMRDEPTLWEQQAQRESEDMGAAIADLRRSQQMRRRDRSSR